MSSTKSRIDLLKEAMSIEKERVVLQPKLERMLARLDEIKDALFSGGADMNAAPIGGRANRAPQSGTLKERVLGALSAAGKAGIRVRDLAVTIGSKPATLHSWFQVARKRIPVIRKAGPGRYRLVGPVPVKSSNAAAKASRPAGSPKVNKRGELAESILGALNAAGGKGVAVSEMSRRFNVNPRNLFVWFSTTAKKYKKIKKLAPGLYCIKG